MTLMLLNIYDSDIEHSAEETYFKRVRVIKSRST